MSTPYQPTSLDSQLFLASGTSYFIGMIPEINSETAAPYYDGVGFASGTTPTFISGYIPQMAGCMVCQITNSITNKVNILIAIRGTEFTEINDWSTDLMAEPYAAPEFTSSNASLAPMVHSGFYLSFMQIKDQILAELTSLLSTLGSTTPIIITGHSKGGGMAPLLAYFLATNTPKIPASQINVETFAGPNPGNADFATAYADAKLTQTNFINYIDAVPWLPLSSANVTKLQAHLSSIIKDPGLLSVADSMMNTFSAWNYAPTTTQVYFIASPTINTDGSVEAYVTTPLSSSFYYLAIDQLAASLSSDSGNVSPNFEAVLGAHSHSCGGVYMLTLCAPSLCPSVGCTLSVPAMIGINDQHAGNGNVSFPLIDFNSTMPGTLFSWTNSEPSIGIPASGIKSLPVAMPINTGTEPIIATITVTPSYSYRDVTTTGTPITFTITVNPSKQ